MVDASSTMPTSSDPPSDFDPYREWLGLSSTQRPFDHYGLLGLEPFEGDRQVISNAAQRKMAELRKRRQGDTARDAQRLIAEMSRATTCLLNPNRKRLYDRHLRDLLDPRHSAADSAGEASRPSDAMNSGRPSLPTRTPAPAAEAVAPLMLAAANQPVLPAIVAPIEKRSRAKRKPPLRGLNPAGLGRHPTVPVAGLALALLVVIVAGILIAMRAGPGDTSGDDQRIVAGRSSGDPPMTAFEGRLSPPPSTATAAIPTGVPTTASSPRLPASEFELAFDVAPSTAPSRAIPVEVSLPPEVALPLNLADDRLKAIRFAGTDRISLPEPLTSLDFAKPFTLEMWVRFDKGTYAHWLMGDLVFGNTHPDVAAGVTAGWQAWIMQTEGGKQRFAVATGKGFWAEYPASEDAWRHLAVSGDGITVSIYVDGRRAASQSAAILADHHVASPLPLHFGAHNYMHPTQPPGLQGQLRAARISTVCRYGENFTPPAAFERDDATELVFDFQHAESSRRINDLSRHARHGVLWGAQWLVMSEAVSAPAASTVAPVAPTAATDLAATSPVAIAGGEEPATPVKLLVPSETELQAARQRIEALLETEIAAARRSAEQLALAAKLVTLAGESTGDSADQTADQYVLFEMATQWLADGNDWSKSLKVIDDQASRFEIDRLARRAAVIRTAGNGSLKLGDRQELAEAALRNGEEMNRAGRFQLAEAVAQVAVTAATRLRSQDLGRRARLLRDDARRSSHLAKEADLARQQLATTPEDPSANQTYGKFLCLQMNQWSAGAALLAKSDDALLQPAAVAELKAAEGAEAQATAAELWYAARAAVDKSDLAPLLEHALALSRAAVPGLTAIARLTVEKRMQQIAAELPARPAGATPGNAPLPRFEPPQEFQSLVGRMQVDGRDAGILWKYRTGLQLADSNVADALLQTGLVARGRVQLDFVGKLNLPETTTVNVMHQGGSPLDATATLYVDGKLIGMLGGEHATSDVYKLDLAKGEHTVRWQLAGRDLAINSLRFTAAAEAAPLVVYHDAMLLTTVRETPSRARLTVNLIGALK